ncbi:hypothetical protein GCM10025876_35500 [Demequina litorisediminis]|uniref:Uncharacterized protein n=1 Tax=Demequina litorisediminis TaxID=1849022 RepID=A0ABQ6IHZ5_9MICO|nr:hypothetical protein GCM10025876_35500 [Demequina litorisediminis]
MANMMRESSPPEAPSPRGRCGAPGCDAKVKVTRSAPWADASARLDVDGEACIGHREAIEFRTDGVGEAPRSVGP